jgi:hypothetical protein
MNLEELKKSIDLGWGQNHAHCAMLLEYVRLLEDELYLINKYHDALADKLEKINALVCE